VDDCFHGTATVERLLGALMMFEKVGLGAEAWKYGKSWSIKIVRFADLALGMDVSCAECRGNNDSKGD
jgi:hypothetical protein